MDYRVVMMEGAEEDLDRFVAYLLFEKKTNRLREICWMTLRKQRQASP